ncbi:MAG: hypothetical protein J6N70_08055 [Oribacterium sp.]|nr:hypothetical protein [Oribacterium sp.]
MAADMTVDITNTVMSEGSGINFTVQPITLENPTLIKDAQETSSFYNMPVEDLLLDALKEYKKAKRMDDFFERIQRAEEVSDEENAEIGAELVSMTDEDRRIARIETVTI